MLEIISLPVSINGFYNVECIEPGYIRDSTIRSANRLASPCKSGAAVPSSNSDKDEEKTE